MSASMSTTEQAKPISVAIIGGGIGGLTLALGLLELDSIDVQVYEAAKEFGEVGLGVNIAPNSQQALRRLSPNTEKAFLSEATHNMWPSHAQSFTTNVCGMKGPDDGRLITRQVNKTGARSVHRAKFLAALVKYMPTERAHFNKRLVNIEQPDVRGGEKLVLHFKDGSRAEADCVIGADGIHSRVREAVLGSQHVGPQFSGSVCFRSLIPMEKASKVLGEEYAQNCYLLCGKDAGIFSYPVEHGDSLNVIMMDFNHPKWEADKWVVPSDKNELKRVLQGWNSTAEGLIELMDAHNLEKWAIHDLPHLPFYHKGRIVLMGDAAHATTPFQGQGAGQAIEDALTLKTLLSAVQNISQIRPAFRAFDLARRARTQAVVTTSRRSGALVGMLLEGVGEDLIKMKEELDVCYEWMWNRDLDDQNREALVLMKEAVGKDSEQTSIV